MMYCPAGCQHRGDAGVDRDDVLIGLHLAETAHPRIHSSVPDLQTGRMVGSARGRICCQMDIVTIEGAVFFGSATFLLEDLQRRLKNHPRMANLLIRMHQANILDASGIHSLEILLEEIQERGGGLYFAEDFSGVQEFGTTSGGGGEPFPHHNGFCHSSGNASGILPSDLRQLRIHRLCGMC